MVNFMSEKQIKLTYKRKKIFGQIYIIRKTAL